jgi:hypothetical protein
MDHYSILDHSSSSPAMPATGSGSSASRSAATSVSARLVTTNPRSEPEARFPGEDAGRSLAEMAQRDLDAALQLLADRAQYITGASGAAIALRRGEHNDMLCRANAGSNAPELGALLSMEYGLSGECVRTRQLLRCDDAERDPRVNRDICRELGIASVVVMPILSREQVLGVFELLSGKPRAFSERDLSALLRLSEMVETAVKHAVAAQVPPAVPEAAVAQIQPTVDAVASTPAPLPLEITLPKPEEPLVVPKKPLFWSAAVRAQATVQPNENTETIAVSPVLRNLQKCQACGFPVSQGRAFCVECEERQWRGQRLPHPAIGVQKDAPPSTPTDSKKFTGLADALRSLTQDSSSVRPPIGITEHATADDLPKPHPAPIMSAPASAISPAQDSISPPTEPADAAALVTPQPAPASDPPADLPVSDSAPFLSSTLPSESWFASNKYILGALLVVAIVIAAIAWLR